MNKRRFSKDPFSQKVQAAMQGNEVALSSLIVTGGDRILCVDCYQELLNEQDQSTYFYAYVKHGVCDCCGLEKRTADKRPPVGNCPAQQATIGRAEVRLKTHELKTLPEYFGAQLNGMKKFEVRKNDRGFQCLDIIILREWDGSKYTGRKMKKRITYVLGHDVEGIEKGFVVLGTSDLLIT